MITALIPAGGSGTRLGCDGPKALVPVLGRPMLAWSIEALAAVESVSLIAVAAPADAVDAVEELRNELNVPKWTLVVTGGAERGDSVRTLVEAVDSTYSLVHDAARPCVTSLFVTRLIRELNGAPAGIPACPVTDTLKRGRDGRVVETVNRDGLFAVQTPQIFRTDLLRRAHQGADGPATDDAALVERLGEEVRLLRGDADNIKVTYPADVDRAAGILASRT